jgi:glycosidase
MSDIDWFKKSIIYHILIDRFAGFKSIVNYDKPIFLGGNIKGIIEKIPYIKNLGINTLWISPFYMTNRYHGYHITDFLKVDSHFGTIDDFKKLIKVVHKEKMRIIADFVPNHCSNKHPFFIDAQSSKQSYYFNWFYFKKWPNDYLCFLDIKDLPKINLDYKPAREYIIKAAKYWLGLGLDGYRLDHVIGPSNSFWNQFKLEIKKEYPHVVLIGEAWMHGIKFKELKTLKIKWKTFRWLFRESSESIMKNYVRILDGVLDFKLREIIKKYIVIEKLSDSKQILHYKIKMHYKKYPKEYFLPIFLDNHDMNRFLFECKNNKGLLKKAVIIQFSLNQPIIIYYGTETGIIQNKSIFDFKSHGDLQVRQPMNWKEQDKELLLFFKKIIKQRKSSFDFKKTEELL